MNEQKRKQLAFKTKSEQTIMTGILTEEDIFSAMMRKYGARGGGKNSPAQMAWRKKAMEIINERKRAKKAARIAAETQNKVGTA